MYKICGNGIKKIEDGKPEIHFFEGSRFWGEYQKWLLEGNTPEPEDVPIVTEGSIRAEFSDKMKQVAYPYSQEERETWFKQAQAVEIYNIDGTITPFIQIMADTRGIDVEVLLNKIQENIDLYDITIFTLISEQQKKIDELNTNGE